MARCIQDPNFEDTQRAGFMPAKPPYQSDAGQGPDPAGIFTVSPQGLHWSPSASVYMLVTPLP